MLLAMATKKAPAKRSAGAKASPAKASIEQAEPTGALVHLPQSVPTGPLPDPRRSDVDAWGRSEHMRELARRAFQPFYDRWFRAEWDGLEKIPTDGGALLVANHAGAIPADAPVIMHGIETELHRAVYGLADNMFRDLPFVGTLWSRAAGSPLTPTTPTVSCATRAISPWCSPRGPRAPASSCGTATDSVASAGAATSRSPCGPVFPSCRSPSSGSEEAMPIVMKFPNAAKALGIPYLPLTVNMLLGGPLGIVPLPAKFRIKVLDPISFDVDPDQPRYSKSRIMDASEDIRERIQEALFEMLRARNSPWFG